LHKNPKPTVDIIVIDGERVVLVKREKEPFKGQWVFPGGFVEYGETVEDAALRELLEETGIEAEIQAILGVYSKPERDPRAHHISVVFIADYIIGNPKGGDDAAEAAWHQLDELTPRDVACEHGQILSDFKKWLRIKGTYWSSLTERD
jgi:mutator protein MutT